MNIITYEELDSTQLEAKRMIKENSACHGTIIVAKNQTKGLGTHGRKWISKKSESVTFTIIAQPDCNIKEIKNLTIDIAKCIVKVFFDLYNVKLEIKEPNDIIYSSKKIGGILTESKISGDRVKYIFIGIGLNTNQTKFTNELKEIATSIKNEFNIEVDNSKIIEKISEEVLKML